MRTSELLVSQSDRFIDSKYDHFLQFLIGLISIVNPRQSETSLVQNKHPVILIPGDGGSRAYVRLKTSPISSPRLMWLTLKFFVLPNYFTNVFELEFDRKLNKSYDNENYEITFPGWGDTYSVEYLDSYPHCFGSYFSPIIRALVEDPFFKRNISVHGAPYDFRRAPNENQWFQKALTQLIEDTYQRNGLSPVVLVAHSMGNLYTHSFLRAQTSAWKKKYVKAYIAVSGPFGGTVKAPKTCASGKSTQHILKFVLFTTFNHMVPFPPTPYHLFVPSEVYISSLFAITICMALNRHQVHLLLGGFVLARKRT
ncbi:Phosphatidylcholine-sterol acyltransferase (Lecithin-cholesterol acyltransferase)/ Phospholipase A [Paragonimus heterotremus]|uniref:Phosphatidylcholine-sterol acyltransferase (Lecithin-cholesterol acyltransferase)/ Phospholipase A n=1 Tax=Paragonimus heterotremus TaxID=100268 RepID=A0A8J4WPU9_9TREM|nr:Phosphatidylcholine-sterol acyltransferase (Lecithin-cholesterol acyltransferase)/ Phospholipase A [Paragonimus heterotremus]